MIIVLARRKNKNKIVGPIYGFALSWLVLSFIFPMFRIWSIIICLAICSLIAFLIGKSSAKHEEKNVSGRDRENAERAEQAQQTSMRKSYGPDVDAILIEGNRALSEMGRLYMSIKDPDIRSKINEIMHITDKITQDAIEDPSDIPQIKKFFNYYLPTTIKLLNAYDRMSYQGIAGENIDKSMKSITEMLDVAIDAYKKRLDSLFENQAMDIETDIDVLNKMLAREGLAGNKDFDF